MTTATYWGIDPETGGLRKVDEEKLAVSMWKSICKMRGWPEGIPYEIKDPCDNTNWTWREKTCDALWRRVYRKRGLIKTEPVDVLIQRKKEVIRHINIDLAERVDLSPSERSMLGDMMDESLEELEKLMNPDDDKDEDAKMKKKKKKEEDDERVFVSHNPMMAAMDRRCRLLKRKADEGDEEATKALAKEASTCF